MDIEANLTKVYEMKHFSVPKARYKRLPQSFVDSALERADHWLIPCSHTRHDHASERQIGLLVSGLGQAIPAQLTGLLEATNGASLFNLHYRPTGFDDYWIARYRILNCSQLVAVNQELRDIFLSYAEHDDEYCETGHLNYVAFCDVGDGNYLAVSLEEPDIGSVFFLDHEYGFYPFSSKLAKEGAYTHVASSLDQWLVQLARTGGWNGLGGRFIPL
jgi:hypothetical protein